MLQRFYWVCWRSYFWVCFGAVVVLGRGDVLAEGGVPFESRTFFGVVRVEMGVAEGLDGVEGVRVVWQDSFRDPVFDAEAAFALPWEREMERATWGHCSLGVEGAVGGGFRSCFFLPVHRDLLGFRSPLPLLVLDTERRLRVEGRTFQDCFWGLIEPSEELPFPGPFTASGRGGIKIRGSSSRSSQKAPMALELRDWQGEDEALGLLDFAASSDWVLSPPSAQDPSLIRNPLIFALSRDCGQYAPETRMVEVFLNDTNRQLDARSDYYGVYALTEKIKAQAGRVELDPEGLAGGEEGGKSLATGALGLSEGILFKFDRPGPGERGVSLPDFGAVVYLVSPKEEEILARDRDILQARFAELARLLKAGEEEEAQAERVSLEALAAVIDLPSWHTWRWLGELAKDVDLYRASSYFHLPVSGPEAGLIKAGPVWDFDRSMASGDPRDDDPEGWTAGMTWLPDVATGEAPWWGPLLENREFRKAHCQHWQRLRVGPLRWAQIEKHLQRFEGELTEKLGREGENVPPQVDWSPFQRNAMRWPGMGPGGGSLASEIALISGWLQRRLAWLDAEVEAILVD